MDIFTTQLTRVVPVKIQPSKLKVKALAKDAAASKLTEDDQHLEDHPDFHTNTQHQSVGTIEPNSEQGQAGEQLNKSSDDTITENNEADELGYEQSYGPKGKVAEGKKDCTGMSATVIKHLDITDESEATEHGLSSNKNDQTAASKSKEDDLAKSHKPPHLDIYI